MIIIYGKTLLITASRTPSFLMVDSALYDLYERQFDRMGLPYSLKYADMSDFDEDGAVFWGHDSGGLRHVYEISISEEDLAHLEQDIDYLCSERGVRPEEIRIYLD